MKTLNTVFLIYDGVEVLDFTGPFDVFSMANITGAKNPFNLITVSPDGKPIKTIHGLSITPDFKIDDVPDNNIDILVIPGGLPNLMETFDQKYPEVIDWILETKMSVIVFATVCVGALIAAKAGIFHGLKATTHHDYLDKLDKFADGEATVIPGSRYVENNGKPRIISSAGVSAGIDMAFHLVGLLEGEETRKKTANIMEYNGTANWVYG